jgi:hypothetical protein
VETTAVRYLVDQTITFYHSAAVIVCVQWTYTRHLATKEAPHPQPDSAFGLSTTWNDARMSSSE